VRQKSSILPQGSSAIARFVGLSGRTWRQKSASFCRHTLVLPPLNSSAWALLIHANAPCAPKYAKATRLLTQKPNSDGYRLMADGFRVVNERHHGGWCIDVYIRWSGRFQVLFSAGGVAAEALSYRAVEGATEAAKLAREKKAGGGRHSPSPNRDQVDSPSKLPRLHPSQELE
jgi:hypothetical protein